MICLLSCLLLLGMGLAVAADAEAAPAPTRRYHGIRPTDPRGREGLHNPSAAGASRRSSASRRASTRLGPAHHLKGKVSPALATTGGCWIAAATRSDGSPWRRPTATWTNCRQAARSEKLACLRRGLTRCGQGTALKAVLRLLTRRTCRAATARCYEYPGAYRPTGADHPQEHRRYLRDAGGLRRSLGRVAQLHPRPGGDHAALAAIVDRILKVLPADRMTQVRVPSISGGAQPAGLWRAPGGERPDGAHRRAGGAHRLQQRRLPGRQTCGGTWNEEPFFSNRATRSTTTEESPYVAIDGELFWADQGGKVDGLQAATRLRLHHYSSFSLAHSFRARGEADPLTTGR